MEFSEDQAAAYDAAAELLARAGVDLAEEETTPRDERDEPELYAVLGRAGSGKTVLLAELVRAVEAAGVKLISGDYEPRRKSTDRTCAVLAPTNKAASVLRGHGVPATTIHRILYIPVYDPEFEAIADWLAKPSGKRPEVEGLSDEALDRARAFFEQQKSIPGALAAAGLSGSDFIAGWKRRDEPLDIAFVDEASMIDDRQLDDLKEVFGTVILFGDPAQLAPVGQAGAMAFDSFPEARTSHLGRIHRQKADSPILDLAHALKDEQLGFHDFEQLIENLAAKDERVVWAERANSDLMARSPMLVWRNATRLRLISAFRGAHGLNEFDMAPGEPLICDGIELPLKHRKKRIDLEIRGLVKGAQVVYLGAGRKSGFARLHVLGAEEPQISVAAIIKIEAPGRDEPFIPHAAHMGAAFVHGAACTIHKSQGSQWPDVQVFAPDIFAAAQSGRSEAGLALWRRLAYVAVTRTQERLIWVTRARISRPERPLDAADLKGVSAGPALTAG